jgi:hypothetical protein
MRSALCIFGMVGLSLNPTAATSGTTAECHEPLQASPGWTHIPQRPVDSWTGAYHDAHSGAFLEFDVVTAGTLSADRAEKPGIETDIIAGTVGDANYQVRRVPIREEVHPRLGAAGQSSQGDKAALPGGRATRLYIVLSWRDRVWTFASDTYSAEQEQRVRDFVIGEELRLCKGDDIGDGPLYHSVVKASAYTALRKDATLREVLTAFGQPLGATPRPPDGVGLRYLVEEKAESHKQVELYFDRQQRLIAKQLAQRQ